MLPNAHLATPHAAQLQETSHMTATGFLKTVDAGIQHAHVLLARQHAANDLTRRIIHQRRLLVGWITSKRVSAKTDEASV
jgi:hypothetical protein